MPSKTLYFFASAAAVWLLGAVAAEAQPPRPRPRPVPARPRPRLTVEGLKEAPRNVRLTDLRGRDLSTQLDPQADGENVTVSLTTPGPFVVKTRDVKTVSATRAEKITLPGGVVMPLLAAPDHSTPAKMTWFRPTLQPSPMPAVWDEATREYVTRLTFGIERKSDAPVTLDLDEPVLFKLSYDGLTAPELPAIVISGSGLANEKTVELRFQPRNANPTLLVRSSITDSNVKLAALPRLEVRPVQAKILGFGLGLADILVQQLRPYGKVMPAASDVVIGLEISGRATPEPRQVSLKTGSADAMFQLRSAGLGPVSVRATADGISGRTTIEQQFPTGPLLATLFGGALGGVARRFRKGGRAKKVPQQVAEGLLVSSIAFVAGVLGVGYLGLPAIVVATEAGAFLTGALSGFGGVMVLETIGRRAAPPGGASDDDAAAPPRKAAPHS